MSGGRFELTVLTVFHPAIVLLQHQRAKHYRCPYCPRRLNTSGGLTVHLHQVHKAEPTTSASGSWVDHLNLTYALF